MSDKETFTSVSRPADSTGVGGAGTPPNTKLAAHPVAEHGAQRHDDSVRVIELERQVAELDDRWRRAVADLDNLRKRYARDSEQQRWQERARVAAAWLPIVDNLELALNHATADPGAIVQGVRAVRDQALTVLAGLGFPRRDDTGAVFDPGRHEAVAVTADAHATPGTVIQVVRPGYGDGEHQLRPAAVVVAAAPSADPASAVDTDEAGGPAPGHRSSTGAQ